MKHTKLLVGIFLAIIILCMLRERDRIYIEGLNNNTNCSGKKYYCSLIENRAQCVSSADCTWSGGTSSDCSGVPFYCDLITNGVQCGATSGCTWLGDNPNPPAPQPTPPGPQPTPPGPKPTPPGPKPTPPGPKPKPPKPKPKPHGGDTGDGFKCEIPDVNSIQTGTYNKIAPVCKKYSNAGPDSDGIVTWKEWLKLGKLLVIIWNIVRLL